MRRLFVALAAASVIFSVAPAADAQPYHHGWRHHHHHWRHRICHWHGRYRVCHWVR
jgi:hypothetical protein